jgi:hypothetical protein
MVLHGEGSHEGSAYSLPVTDTAKARRNFQGYEEHQLYTLEDIRMGDTHGTTETDSKTDPKGSGGYTKINTKSGKAHGSKR